MNEINKIHKTIKFTHEASDTELDVTLCKGDRFLPNSILDTCTHIKPTNKQLYVHSDSYHFSAIYWQPLAKVKHIDIPPYKFK